MKVTLLWSTPDAEKQILRMARVSSQHRDSENTKLLGYLIREHHWSPFEMANMCVEIEASRAMIRQILRHRTFTFQEFSQRYATQSNFTQSEARRQDVKNRQNSINDLSDELKQEWNRKQAELNQQVSESYQWALQNGIAKECARNILPEGNTTSILCMNGTLRSWIHYLQLRCGNGTQEEHRDIANAIKDIFQEQFPIIYEAAF